jgi:hypothetical protein
MIFPIITILTKIFFYQIGVDSQFDLFQGSYDASSRKRGMSNILVYGPLSLTEAVTPWSVNSPALQDDRSNFANFLF